MSLQHRRWPLSAWLLILTLAVPLTAGAPLVPDTLQGFGTATTFQILGEGLALEGGAYRWTNVCGACQLLVTVRDGTFIVIDADGVGRTLAPGVHELREFRGLMMQSQRAPHDFAVELHGTGKFIER